MFYYVILALTVAAFVLCHVLLRSRIGYFWLAIREDEEAARALGIDTFRYKMIAVVISAGMTAVAGVFFAFYYNNLFPEQVFHISRSIELILGPIIGGIGTLFGPIIGAFLLTGLSEGVTELLHALGFDVPGAKQVFYGVCLLFVVMVLPDGIWPPLARRLGLERRLMSALFEVAGVSKNFSGLRAVDRVSFEVRGGRDLRGDRPERRRQDHAVQHDRRRVRAGRRHDRVSGRAHRRAAPGRGVPPRHRAHLPDRAAVPGADASRTTSWSARCCARADRGARQRTGARGAAPARSVRQARAASRRR